MWSAGCGSNGGGDSGDVHDAIAGDIAPTDDGDASLTGPAGAAASHVLGWLEDHADPEGRTYAWLLLEYPEIVDADVTLFDGSHPIEVTREGSCSLFWFDPDPVAGYIHPTTMLLVSGEDHAVTEIPLDWWPVVGEDSAWGVDVVVYDPSHIVRDERSDAPVIVEDPPLEGALLAAEEDDDDCPKGKRVALVILGRGSIPAVSKSDTTSGVKGSQSRIENFLTSKGVGCEEVTVIGDGERDVDDSEIDKEIANLAAATKPGDEVIIFYEGHGGPGGDWAGTSNESKYMTPIGLALSLRLNFSGKDAARDIMVVSDSCFSGGMGQTAGNSLQTAADGGQTTGMDVTFVDATDADEHGHVDNGNPLLQSGSWFTKYALDPITDDANKATDKWDWDALKNAMDAVDGRTMHRGWIMGDQTSHTRTVSAPGKKCGCGNGVKEQGEECDGNACEHGPCKDCKCPAPPKQPAKELEPVGDLEIIIIDKPMPQPAETGPDVPYVFSFSLRNKGSKSVSRPVPLGDVISIWLDFTLDEGLPALVLMADDNPSYHAQLTGFQAGGPVDGPFTVYFELKAPLEATDLVGEYNMRFAIAPDDGADGYDLERLSNIVEVPLVITEPTVE